jgi:hypothetical protein
LRSIRHAFVTHRAGQFHITSSEAAKLSQAFRFLGYWFVKPIGKKARAFLPSDVWQLKETEFVTKFADAETLKEMLDICAGCGPTIQRSNLPLKPDL